MRRASAAPALAGCLMALATAASAHPVPAPAPPAPATQAAGDATDAAAKHARRTACLRQARAKKLLGGQRASFLNACNGAPAAKPAPKK